MGGSLMRLVSVVMLLVIGGLSTARALCVLPCLTDAAAADAANSGHCEHPASDPVAAVAAHSGACDTCDEVGVDSVDRLSLRNSVIAWLSASAGVSVSHIFSETAGLVHDPGPPPGLRAPVAASIPLRI